MPTTDRFVLANIGHLDQGPPNYRKLSSFSDRSDRIPKILIFDEVSDYKKYFAGLSRTNGPRRTGPCAVNPDKDRVN